MRYTACERATIASEITAELVGGEAVLPAPCAEYVPARHDSVLNVETSTFKALRLCKHGEYQEAAHDEPEPADSTRLTIVPGAPEVATEPTAVVPSDEAAATAAINVFMAGPPATYLARVYSHLAVHLGRLPNTWELLAMRRYLASVVVDILTEAAR